MAKMTFDEAIKLNVPSAELVSEFGGTTPENLTLWLKVLKDLATSLYEWRGDIDFYDLLMIEKLIYEHKQFALVRTRYKKGNAIIYGGFHIFECVVLEWGGRMQPKKIRIVEERLAKDLERVYHLQDFVYFDNWSDSYPHLIAYKYANMLAKLDALYSQNADKLSVPIIGIVRKSLKNEFLNLFRRTKFNALYTFLNGDRADNHRIQDSFFNPNIEFLLDKINEQRNLIMKEYIQEMGVNTTIENVLNSQYTNLAAISESSLVSKYFGAVMNKYRNNFVRKVKQKFDININFETIVNTNTTRWGESLIDERS